MHAHINHQGSWAFNLVVVVVEGGGCQYTSQKLVGERVWERGSSDRAIDQSPAGGCEVVFFFALNIR